MSLMPIANHFIFALRFLMSYNNVYLNYNLHVQLLMCSTFTLIHYTMRHTLTFILDTFVYFRNYSLKRQRFGTGMKPTLYVNKQNKNFYTSKSKSLHLLLFLYKTNLLLFFNIKQYYCCHFYLFNFFKNLSN